VHISNIYEREEYRHVNYIKDECIASVIGKGLDGYLEAINILINRK
jgi:3-dehydroquinate dehydratase-2